MGELVRWPDRAPTTADEERRRRYAEALDFYNGSQWETRNRRGETRLTVNYARALVRKIGSYVFPGPVLFEVSAPGDDAGLRVAARRAELALGAAVAANDLGRLDLELCIDAAVLGDAAIKVTWDARQGRPLVVAVDPASLSVATAPDQPRRMLSVSQRYLLAGRDLRQVLGDRIDPSGIDPDRQGTVVEAWSDDRWRVSVDGVAAIDEPNPYGWIPYVVLANTTRPHAFWGESDLTDLYDLCRELNSRMTVLSRVLELSGAPIAVLENVDHAEGIAVGPGALWELPEGAKAYLLDLLSGGGVTLHVDYVNLLYRAIHDLAETPRTAFGDSGRQLSGAALEVEIQPLVQKVQRKRRLFDTLYRERNWRVLDLLERFGGEDLAGLRRTSTLWPSILPSDNAAAITNAARMVSAGIQSRRSAAAALGNDDPEGELARILEESALFADPREGRTA